MTVRELREALIDLYEINFMQEDVVFKDQTVITDDLLDKNIEALRFDEWTNYRIEIFTK